MLYALYFILSTWIFQPRTNFAEAPWAKMFNKFNKIKMQKQEITTNKEKKPKNRKVSAGSTFSLEKELLEQGFDAVIGVDEAGRGPLCGPVVACAVVLRNFQFSIFNFQSNSNEKIFNDPMWELVRDSKKLSEKQREKVFDFIHENFHVGVGLCNHETVDRINILEASFLAMKKAVQELQRNIKKESSISYKLPASTRGDSSSTRGGEAKSCVLVDGNKVIPNFSMEQKAVVGGDKIVKSISAASIIAKVTRDRMMMEMHTKYPQYGFDKHKGYGTKMHMDALSKYGPCEIHRQSFAPVTRLLRTADRKKEALDN